MYWEFHEQGGRQAIRKDNWKLVRYNVLNAGKTTTELYDLSNDPGEETNMAKEHPEIVKELLDQIKSSRFENQDFPFIEKR
jgi:arylsulfatase A-like enzyme